MLESLRVVEVNIRLCLWRDLSLLVAVRVEERRSSGLHATSRHRGRRVAWNARVERRHGRLRVQLVRRHRAVLFLELASALTLLALDALPFRSWQHLLVLDPQLPAVELKVVHVVNDSRRLVCVGEVGESQATENTVVEVVVESIWERQSHVGHDRNELFLLDGKRNVLDDDGSRDELLVNLRVVRVLAHLRSTETTETHEVVVGHGRLLLVEPGLESSQ